MFSIHMPYHIPIWHVSNIEAIHLVSIMHNKYKTLILLIATYTYVHKKLCKYNASP